jgi:hypothetical protein
MGGELAVPAEWNHDGVLAWDLATQPLPAGVLAWVRDLNAIYRRYGALHHKDCTPGGLEWLLADDREHSTLAWARWGGPADAPVVIACNFTPVPRHGMRIGAPRAGRWREVLSSDAEVYGGSGVGNLGERDRQRRAVARPARVADVDRAAAGLRLPRARGRRAVIRRWVCVHGHFYQPPRENPWLDEIEPQPSAAPFPDWNARITAECYRPNTAARIVDGHGDIIAIVDNYARMSWNVGPTLLTWLARHAPDVHAALIAADRASVAALGHGAALAQAHGHLIMPLCTPRDRADAGALGPGRLPPPLRPRRRGHVAARVRGRHRDARGAGGRGRGVHDPGAAPGGAGAAAGRGVARRRRRRARARLPLPAAVGAHDRSVRSTTGRWRARWRSRRLLATTAAASRGGWSAFAAATPRRCATSPPTARPTATTTATATWRWRGRWSRSPRAITRARRSPTTARSAPRTRRPGRCDPRGHRRGAAPTASSAGAADCGCNSGGRPGWTQAWRASRCGPRSTGCAERLGRAARHCVGATLCHDAWAARDAYVDVLLVGDDRDRTVRRAPRARPGADPVRVLALMEMSRATRWRCTPAAAGSSTTSAASRPCRCCATRRGCAELGESCSAAHAARRRGFVDRAGGGALERRRLVGDGRTVWKRLVDHRRRVDPAKLLASHAVVVAVTGHEPPSTTAAPTRSPSRTLELTRRRVGRAALAAGRGAGRARSITGCDARAGVRGAARWAITRCWAACARVRPTPRPGPSAGRASSPPRRSPMADLLAVQRAIDRGFVGATFSLATLLPHDRELVLAAVLAGPLAEVERAHQAIYDDHAPVIRFLVASRLPVPPVFARAATHVLEARLTAELGAPRPRIDVVRDTLVEAGQLAVDLDTPAVAYLAGAALHRAIAQLDRDDDPAPLERLAKLAEIAARMKSPVDLWDAQNAAWRLRPSVAAWKAAAAAGDDEAARSHAAFVRLAQAIRVKLG